MFKRSAGRAALYGGVALFALGMGVTPVTAQDVIDEEDEEDLVEEVVVTGSRLRRSTFNSASPVQVISGEISREVGIFDTSALLQTQTQATGFQVDNSLQGFVLDNGVGASSVNLRNLGADRSLVLLNGRRLVPGGVGGAPGVPDINLLPNILIQRAETLLDGASAVYGSDAIAGVVNLITRTDVDGLIVEANGSLTESGGGENYTIGALYGDSGENWKFTVAGEYFNRERLTFNDRGLNTCDEYLFEDEQGDLFRGNFSGTSGGLIPGHGTSRCRVSAYNRIIEGTGILGSIYATPGFTNINLPGWSDTTLGGNAAFLLPSVTGIQYDSTGDGVADRFAFDGDQDGAVDLSFLNPQINFNETFENGQTDLLSSLERINLYADGSYNLGDDNNTEVYGEFGYSHRRSVANNPGAFLFPVVPASNPFNPVGTNGLDVIGEAFGFPFGPQTAQPVVVIRGDRDVREASIDQFRFIGGVRGNMGFLDNFLGGNWSYDAYFSYQRSEGDEVTRGLQAERLALSLETSRFDENGNIVCGDGTDGCVPVNFFADSIYQVGGGSFATQAETDYLFVDREFQTTIEQYVGNAYISGDLFDLPWNGATVPLAFGYEFRRDEINSEGNDIATEGLLENFFSDRGAIGGRELHEFFAETALDLLTGVPFAEQLTVELSGRITDESFFSPEFTGSAKVLWRPVDFLTLRGTYGSSFRAPNLRERFIRGTTGFITFTDQCVVPLDNRDTDISNPVAAETYNPDGDNRTPNVIAGCQANGVDPFSLGLRREGPDGGTFQFNPASGIEVSTVGSGEPNAETSIAWTAGMVFDQPFTDAFNLQLSATYYSIEINNALAELSSRAVYDQCYNNPNGPTQGQLCDLVERNAETGQLDFITRIFNNIAFENSRGVDFNLLYEQDFEIGSEILSATVDLRATYQAEAIDESDGEPDDQAGEPFVPNWRAQGRLALQYNDFRVSWFTRWIQGAIQDEDTIDPFASNNVPCNFDVNISCRPVSFTSNYDVHNLSFTWSPGDYTFAIGMTNVFDTEPPEVDAAGVFSRNNIPLGVGYDLNGRTFFASARVNF